MPELSVWIVITTVRSYLVQSAFDRQYIFIAFSFDTMPTALTTSSGLLRIVLARQGSRATLLKHTKAVMRYAKALDRNAASLIACMAPPTPPRPPKKVIRKPQAQQQTPKVRKLVPKGKKDSKNTKVKLPLGKHKKQKDKDANGKDKKDIHANGKDKKDTDANGKDKKNKDANGKDKKDIPQKINSLKKRTDANGKRKNDEVANGKNKKSLSPSPLQRKRVQRPWHDQIILGRSRTPLRRRTLK